MARLTTHGQCGKPQRQAADRNIRRYPSPRELGMGSLLAVLLVVTNWQCARVVAPTGGPKDYDPPRVTRTNPANGATEFKLRSLRIYLNEHISLHEPQKHITISPPLASPPIPAVQGKSVILHVGDSLRPNTTYSVQFGKAIVDLTERNPLPPYVYSFSTGSTLDTCWIEGQARNALLHKPHANAIAALYRAHEDSAATSRPPDFVAHSDDQGQFLLTNLPAGQFWLACIVEKNGNLRYDNVEEEIGFSPHPISSECLRRITTDDSITQRPDSTDTAQRSIPKSAKQKSAGLRIETFKQKWQRQYLVKSLRTDPDQLLFIFAQRNQQPIDLAILHAHNHQSIREVMGDSIRWWIMDSAVSRIDTLTVMLTHTSTDTAHAIRQRTDTLRMALHGERKATKRQKDPPPTQEQPKPKPKDALPVDMGSQSFSAFVPGDSIVLTLAAPPVIVDSARITIRQKPDSALRPFQFRRLAMRPRHFSIIPAVSDRQPWRIEILPGAFIDAHGRTNDTLIRQVDMVVPSQRCIVRIALRNAPATSLVQLITVDGGKVAKYQQVSLTGQDTLTFRHIEPATYGIRIVEDRNGNQRWDGGDYYTRTLPEAVRYFVDPQGQTSMQVRANWEYDVDVDYSTLPE